MGNYTQPKFEIGEEVKAYINGKKIQGTIITCTYVSDAYGYSYHINVKDDEDKCYGHEWVFREQDLMRVIK